MRSTASLFLGLLVLLPSCQQVRQAGGGLSAGTGYITRPVVAGSKMLADATLTGSRKIARATISSTRRVADATVSGTRAVASATAEGGRKMASATMSGARTIAAGATRLVTFGNANRKPAPAPLAPPQPARGEPSLPPQHKFPATGLLVTETELGSDATRLEATAVNLGGGWVLNGDSVAYRLEPGADDPTALRVKGRPATAILTSGDGVTTTATATELHYHSINQVLTLKGGASLSSSTSRVAATAPQTQIRIHLPTGAIAIVGPARWGE